MIPRTAPRSTRHRPGEPAPWARALARPVAARLAAASLLLVAVFVAGPARPDPPPAAGDAKEVIAQLHAALLDAMKNADALGFEGRYHKLEPVMRQTFDFDFMAEKATGRYWSGLSPQDQARMRDVFARFLLSTYANRFHGYSGEHFETHSEEAAPRDTIFVRTELVRTDGEDNVEINYRLHSTPDGWRVIDVLLRGTVSELALRRSEYSSVIKRDGFDALIASLEQKITELASGKVEDSPS